VPFVRLNDHVQAEDVPEGMEMKFGGSGMLPIADHGEGKASMGVLSGIEL